MSMHTPGPWIVEPQVGTNGEIAYHAIVINSDSWHAVASTWNGPNEANARLIASAPDLLAALQASLDRYIRLADSGDCGNWDAEAEEHVIASRAALAKARGEA